MDTRSKKTSGFLAFLLFFVLMTGLLFTSSLTVETPVSYTHLDVYKRQKTHRRRRLRKRRLNNNG